MRRLLTLLALAAALALPLLTPAPASASAPSDCPEGHTLISIAQIQSLDLVYPPGIARAAAAADVNHNGFVCFRERGARGVTFKDDIVSSP